MRTSGLAFLQGYLSKMAEEQKDAEKEERVRLIKSILATHGKGGRGACGGKRRLDGSGRGLGNIGTPRQPEG